MQGNTASRVFSNCTCAERRRRKRAQGTEGSEGERDFSQWDWKMWVEWKDEVRELGFLFSSGVMPFSENSSQKIDAKQCFFNLILINGALEPTLKFTWRTWIIIRNIIVYLNYYLIVRLLIYYYYFNKSFKNTEESKGERYFSQWYWKMWVEWKDGVRELGFFFLPESCRLVKIRTKRLMQNSVFSTLF